jgi:hypothetical protein
MVCPGQLLEIYRSQNGAVDGGFEEGLLRRAGRVVAESSQGCQLLPKDGESGALDVQHRGEKPESEATRATLEPITLVWLL